MGGDAALFVVTCDGEDDVAATNSSGGGGGEGLEGMLKGVVVVAVIPPPEEFSTFCFSPFFSSVNAACDSLSSSSSYLD